MAKRASGEASEEGRSKREQREQRILDAASALALKWGYRKTTLDDIAREARVAKGTIYLSWSTREKLFLAIIERERLRLLQDTAARMAADPVGMSLIGLIKHSILATLANPILRALIMRDSDMLGEWVVREYNTSVYEGQLEGYISLIQLLRDHSLVRTDLDLREQALAVLSASWGPILINHLLPGPMHISDEMMVAIVELTLKRLLEPDVAPTTEQQAAGEAIFRAYIESLWTVEGASLNLPFNT